MNRGAAAWMLNKKAMKLGAREAESIVWPELCLCGDGKAIPCKSQIDNSGSDGSKGGSGEVTKPRLQFRDSEKAYLADELLPLIEDEMKGRSAAMIEQSRRTWLGRIRDEPQAIAEALGEMRDEQRSGKHIRSPLGTIYTKARALLRTAGKLLPMTLCL